MSIKINISNLLQKIPTGVKLVAVSKQQADEKILEAYESGLRLFGENRSQDMRQRFINLPDDIHWHYIGRLQTNKVKYIAANVEMIHSIDSLKLLHEINKEALKHRRTIKCLLQFHIAEEETKQGLDLEQAQQILNSPLLHQMQNIHLCGVMGMATFTDNMEQVRKEFKALKGYFNDLKNSFFTDDSSFSEISMGMSGDFQVAIEEGSTIVRIGTAIFND